MGETPATNSQWDIFDAGALVESARPELASGNGRELYGVGPNDGEAMMFTDWITASFGKIGQYQVRGALFEKIRVLQRVYPHTFTRSTFGALSLCLPGQHWQSIDEQTGFTLVDDILHWCASAHITRFDLAHDWNCEVQDAACIWRAVDTCGARIDKLTGPAGVTWYIGSRESDRFARLYDKRAEIKARAGVDVGFPVLRFEAELKGSAASEYFVHFRRAPEAVQGDLASRYGLAGLMIGAGTDVIRVHGLPAPDPFGFIRRFQKVISYARAADCRLFDELIPPLARDTALPHDTA